MRSFSGDSVNIDRYRSGVMAALESGKTVNALNAIDVNEWKDRASTVGVERAVAAAGSEASKAKELAFLDVFLPYADTVKAEIARMPKGNIEQGKARAMRAIELMAKFKFRR